MAEALSATFSVSKIETQTFDDFYDALDYCRNNSDEFNGDEGTEAWYVWQDGEWAVAGDLSMRLCKATDEVKQLSKSLGDVVCAGIDTSFQYASFSYYESGEMKRFLILEDDEIAEEGFPIAAERGHQMDEFDEEEAERLWTSYTLPTFEYDPPEGPFLCIAVKAD
jgi:hypothetical protein